MLIFRKKIFPALLTRFFLARYQNILKVGKVGKNDEETVCSRKKSFDFHKCLFYRNGKAQNMPTTAGVFYSVRIKEKFPNWTISCFKTILFKRHISISFLNAPSSCTTLSNE